MGQNSLYKGILVMLASSLLTCTGQLCWKMSTGQNTLLFLLRYGDLSKLHPLLSAGYILSVVLGAAVLNEPITVSKVVGVAIIIAGLILINLPERAHI